MQKSLQASTNDEKKIFILGTLQTMTIPNSQIFSLLTVNSYKYSTTRDW